MLAAVVLLLLASAATAIAPDLLTAVRAVPPDIAGRFREPRGFQQAASGQYFVFDRRGHTVFGIDEALASSWQIVQIGAEPGRIIEPTAFAVAPDGRFVVADAPGNQGRIQVFSPAGFRITGFTLPGRPQARITLDSMVMNGIGSMQFNGSSILMSQPETGSLVVEYNLAGRTNRTLGTLRSTGHEDDRDVHLALNSGIPLAGIDGSTYFVFQAGLPVFRKFDRSGQLVFERRMQGREIDDVLGKLPTAWPRNTSDGELPVVAPTVRTAAVDADGWLWVSFVAPFTYVYDADGDKVRTVQFRGVGIVSPHSLFFGRDHRLLVTPGLTEFDARPH